MKNNLIELTGNNDIEGVKKFIADGGDINMQDEYGATALFYVSWFNHLEIAELLIKAGAEVSLKALDIAIKCDRFEIVIALIEAEAKQKNQVKRLRQQK